MTALDRAVALAEVDAVAGGVEEDLDLHMAGSLEEALEDQPVVAEGGPGLASGGRERVRESRRDRGRPASPSRRRRPPA